jgi:O-antigen/teichoic acid export membrane protein
MLLKIKNEIKNGKLRKEIAESPLVKRFFGVFMLDVLAKGSMFLFLPIYLRLMSKEEFGTFSYLLFIVMNISYFIKLGMDTAQAKLYFDYDGAERNKLLFNINLLTVSVFVSLYGVLILSGLDHILFQKIGVEQGLYRSVRWWIVVYVFAFIQQIMLQSYLVADNRAGKFQVYNLMKVLSMSIGSVLVLYFFTSNKIRNRLLVESLSAVLVFTPLTFYFIRQMKPVIDKEMIRRSLAIGLPMLGSVFIGFVYSFIDKYYLQKVHGFGDVAVYSLAIFLTTPVNLIFSSFNLLWFSKFFQEKDAHRNYRQTRKVYLIMLAAFSVLFVILWVGVILSVKFRLIDVSYQPVAVLLPFIFYYRVLESLSNLYTNFLVQGEQTKLIFRITLTVSGMAWLSFALFIPLYGYLAAAVILFLMEFIRTCCLLFFARKIVFCSNKSFHQKGSLA